MRVFPLSNWTELDVWNYIKKENIEVVPLYFAKKRKHVKRHGILIRIDEFNQPREGEEIIEAVSRYRTLGCSPSTGAILSTAKNLDEIIERVNKESGLRCVKGTAHLPKGYTPKIWE